jgi:hypothetical protein
MRTLAVIRGQIPANRSPCFGNAVIGAQVDLLVFDRTPEPFNEHMVPPGAATVHADRDPVL